MGYLHYAFVFSLLIPAAAGAQSTLPAGGSSIQQWIVMINAGKTAQVVSEVSSKLGEAENATIRMDLLYVLARAQLKDASAQPKSAQTIDNFIAVTPKDERGAELLFRLGGVEKVPASRIAIYQRVIQNYSQTSWAIYSKGAIRRIQSIGQPFELKFTDALSGKSIDVQKDLKGRVVVIEFWAGWCSDCAAEAPRIKALYEQYKNKGVDFIGVSLDRSESEGGLTTFKTAVAKQGIIWPQYYQGNYFESEFSKSWGVNATPWAFVVDKNGNLVSADGLKDLDTILRISTQ